jgi:hypothetical protein
VLKKNGEWSQKKANRSDKENEDGRKTQQHSKPSEKVWWHVSSDMLVQQQKPDRQVHDHSRDHRYDTNLRVAHCERVNGA